VKEFNSEFPQACEPVGREFAETVKIPSYGGEGLAKSSYTFYCG